MAPGLSARPPLHKRRRGGGLRDIPALRLGPEPGPSRRSEYGKPRRLPALAVVRVPGARWRRGGVRGGRGRSHAAQPLLRPRGLRTPQGCAGAHRPESPPLNSAARSAGKSQCLFGTVVSGTDGTPAAARTRTHAWASHRTCALSARLRGAVKCIRAGLGVLAPQPAPGLEVDRPGSGLQGGLAPPPWWLRRLTPAPEREPEGRRPGALETSRG